jgi:hypothetical protein
MAFIHEGSCECAKSELDLFSLPSTQTSIESGIYVEYHPISNITGGATIEFDVTATGDDYLDLANSFLCVRAHDYSNQRRRPGCGRHGRARQ